VFWKIYFWLLTIAYALMFGSEVFKGTLDLLHGLDYMLSWVGLVGFFGYIYKRRFFKPVFWKVYFPIQLIWDLVLSIKFMPQSPVVLVIITLTLGFILLLPLYIALFKYAYRFDNQPPNP